MRRAPPPSSLNCLAAAATDAAMSSPRFPFRGRNSWQRGFSGPAGGGREGFVSGDSHFSTVRDVNYGFRRGDRGNYRVAGGFWRPPFRPRPPPRPRPLDYRSWEFALHQPPPHCERFIVLSYNVLADYLAKDHRYLYFHIPPQILDWSWRKRRILIELGLWSPDIICLQEVDRFQDLQEELKLRGYCGVWKMRTGIPVDGCATFWRTTRFKLLHEESIEYDKLGLRNNVAQICVLESRSQSPAENSYSVSLSSSYSSSGANRVVVCNIHVLYNPNRGDIKIGQVRVLLDRAHAVSREWSGAPVIVCGDFNCIPKSPLYNFVSEQKLDLSGLAKNQVSGQYSASIYTPHPDDSNNGNVSNRVQSPSDNGITPSVSVDIRTGSINHAGMQNQHMSPSAPEGASLTDNLSSSQSINQEFDSSEKPCFNEWHEENNTSPCTMGKGEVQERILDGSSDKCGPSYSGLIALNNTVISDDRQGGPVVNQPNLQNYNPVAASPIEDCVSKDTEMEKLSVSMALFSCESTMKLSGDVTSDCSAVASLKEDSISKETKREKHSVGIAWSSCESNIELSGDVTSDCSRSDMVSDTSFPGEVEICSLEHVDNVPSQSVTNEEKTCLSSFQNADIDKLLHASSGVGQRGVCMSHDKACESMEYESLVGKLRTTYSSEEMLTCGTKDMSSFYTTNRLMDEDESLGGSLRTAESSEEMLRCTTKGGLPFEITHVNEIHNLEEFKQSSEQHCSVSNISLRAHCSGANQSAGVTDIFYSPEGSYQHGETEMLPREEVTHESMEDMACSVLPRKEVSHESMEDMACSVLPRKEVTHDSTEDMASTASSSNQTLSSSPFYVNVQQALLSLEGPIIQDNEGTLNGSDATVPIESQLDELISGFCGDDSLSLESKDTDVERKVYDPYVWTPMEIATASGNAESTIVEHYLKLKSAYAQVEDYAGTKDLNREPQVTSYNRRFMGTVDYIWCSEGLQTVKVLDTIPKHVLQRTPGFPTPKWGSDHLALACQLAFTRDLLTGEDR